jgi:Spy/CpxP family protein refolding chaperone
MSRFALRPVIATLTLTLAAGALTGTALAAASGDAAPAAGAPGHAWNHHGKFEQHMQAMRDALWIPGVGPVGKDEVAKLNLNSSQQALFKSAQQAQADLRKSMRSTFQSRRTALRSQIEQGQLDPHALTSQEDQTRDQFRGQAQDVRQKWLAVWDSLDSTQKQSVNTYLKQREQRMEAHRAEHRGAEHHRPAPTGAAPTATPPAPATTN